MNKLNGLDNFHQERTRIISDHDQPVVNGDWVIYWSRTAARGHENPALDVAIRLANSHDRPMFIYHGISESYPYSSRRHHTFMLQGAREFSDECETRDVGYALHVQRDGHRQDHLIDLVSQASTLVVEDFPVTPSRQWQGQLCNKVDTPVVAVDTDCVVPMRSVPSGHERAYQYRNDTKQERERRFGYSWDEPEPVHGPFLPDEPGFEPVDTQSMDIPSLLNQCDIDHAVGPVADRSGGMSEGYHRWKRFRNNGLDDYHQKRNTPTKPNAVSRLSPYLHYGHVSPFRIAREASLHGSDGADKFIDELITWREMAHYFCFYNDTHDPWSTLPEWAKQSLADHKDDKRDHTYTWEQLARAQTHDELWNRCQTWLLRHGELHNNLRMTWAKALLQLTDTPQKAVNMAFDLNNRYALDGRDPNSVLGILWCFGAFDRPYDQDRKIIGKIRPRSTDWHRSRLDMDKLSDIVFDTPVDGSPDIGIIGAGLAGTTAARTLSDHGVEVTVYEKSRGHGGRASTRYSDEQGTIDHGAQYFTIRSDQLEQYRPSWLQTGVIRPWETKLRVFDPETTHDKQDGPARYVGVPTMNQLVKHLADDINVQFETRICSLEQSNQAWKLTVDDAANREHDYVISTAPPRQTAELLGDELPERTEWLQNQTMHPTWTYMAWFNQPTNTNFQAGFVNDSAVIDWIAKNSSKPGRSDRETWVAHATSSWSRDHLEDSRDDVLETLKTELSHYVQLDSGGEMTDTVHRWRYAKAESALDQGSVIDNRIMFCGDWMNGSRIEGAILSGQHAAGNLLSRLSEG